MACLTPQELVSRLAFDHKVAMGLPQSDILEVEGWISGERPRKATLAEGEAGRVTLYVARYRFPILTGPGETMDGATVVFNLDVKGYPHERPLAQVTSRPLPWSPHVKDPDGIVCIGAGWEPSGKTLLAKVILHVAHMLNCDEPDPHPGYGGWNSAAIDYWRRVMHKQPLTPGLPYPALPVEITHGVSAGDTSFVLVPPRVEFVTVAGGLFVPAEPRGQVEDGAFRAVAP